MTPTTPDYAVVIVTYRTGELLDACLDSVRAATGAPIVIIDNSPFDADTPELDRAAEVGATVHRSGENLGFPAACNLGAARSTAPVLVFLNPDTEVLGDALDRIATAVVEHTDVALAMAVVELADRPGVVNSSGNHIHLTGTGWAGGYGEPADEVPALGDVVFPSGAAVAVRREVFEELGGFSEELFLYQEDQDLGWRARMLGYRNVVVGTARVRHHYDFGRNPRKLHYLERNRLIFLTTALPARVLATVAPIALAYEPAVFALAVSEGWWREKVEGWVWLWRHRGELRARRRRFQSTRRVTDAELASLLRPRLDPAMVDQQVPEAVNRLMERYWALVRRRL